LVDLFEYMMMDGLTNPKSTKIFKWLKQTTTTVQTHAEASQIVSVAIHLFYSDKS